jgi:hypothetical protein
MIEEKTGCSNTRGQADELHYVEVMFARTADEASSCCSLLQDHRIPSRTAGGPEIDDRGVAVLVPDMYQDDALEILAMRAQDDDAQDDEETEEGDDDFEDDDDEDDHDDFEDDDDEDEEYEEDE